MFVCVCVCVYIGLMTLEAAAMSGPGAAGLESAWRGAEAYHFWLLAHRQLYRYGCVCVLDITQISHQHTHTYTSKASMIWS